MEIVRLDLPDLGNRSYLVTDGRRAMAIDPPRPSDPVLDIVRSRDLELDVVVDTHLHNDHVSGGPELAEATGATYAVSVEEHVRGAVGLADGEQFCVGSLHVSVVGTPGHTPHHQAFVVSDGPERAVFTGGSLLFATVGRTDLLGADRAAELAADQWASVRWMLDNLPAETGVHPTHGFGSFCSATPCAGSDTTIGAERRINPAAQLECKPFVDELVAGFGEYPHYFAHMAALNREGLRPPAYRDPVPTLADGDLEELTPRMWVIDVRPRTEFATAHVPGTLNAGVDGPLAVYIGWTMPWGTDFALVADNQNELSEARNTLADIGLDRPVGTAVPRDETRAGRLRLATFGELADEWSGDVEVVDVRREEEWNRGHLEGAHHVPVHRISEADLPSGPLWLYCAAGYRAVLGGSLLRRVGRDVVVINDVWDNAGTAGLPISAAVSA